MGSQTGSCYFYKNLTIDMIERCYFDYRYVAEALVVFLIFSSSIILELPAQKSCSIQSARSCSKISEKFFHLCPF